MNRGGWVELAGAMVDAIGLTVRIAMKTPSSGSPLLPASSS